MLSNMKAKFENKVAEKVEFYDEVEKEFLKITNGKYDK
jgi:hypothetical protein